MGRLTDSVVLSQQQSVQLPPQQFDTAGLTSQSSAADSFFTAPYMMDNGAAAFTATQAQADYNQQVCHH